MEEEEIIKKLKSAKLKNIRMESSAASAKRAIMHAVTGRARAQRPAVFKYITAAAALFAFSVLTFYVVDNMDDGDMFNRNGGVWSTYSDRHEGGNSIVWPPEGGFVMSSPGHGGSGWAVRVTGTTGQKLGHNYNYMGVVVRFDRKSQCPECEGTDIKKYKGIKFKIKGSLQGGQLFFVLPHESEKCIEERMTCESLTAYADYQADISSYVSPVWTTVILDFRKDLKQPFWTDKKLRFQPDDVLRTVHLFKWQYRNGSGEVMDLWIDDVELY